MAVGPLLPRDPEIPPQGPSQVERRKHEPELESRYDAHAPKPVPSGVFRSIGLGLITGAADDDPAAIGTYATAGARFGPAVLWLAPVLFPMMFAVVYLSSKLGQVTGQGLFAIIKRHYPRWMLYLLLGAVLIGNTIEAAVAPSLARTSRCLAKPKSRIFTRPSRVMKMFSGLMSR